MKESVHLFALISRDVTVAALRSLADAAAGTRGIVPAVRGRAACCNGGVLSRLLEFRISGPRSRDDD